MRVSASVVFTVIDGPVVRARDLESVENILRADMGVWDMSCQRVGREGIPESSLLVVPLVFVGVLLTAGAGEADELDMAAGI